VSKPVPINGTADAILTDIIWEAWKMGVAYATEGVSSPQYQAARDRKDEYRSKLMTYIDSLEVSVALGS